MRHWPEAERPVWAVRIIRHKGGGNRPFAAQDAKVCYAGAVSTGRCNTGLEFLGWRMVLQGLSGPLVELACDSAEFGLTKT